MPKLEDFLMQDLKDALNSPTWKKYFCQKENGQILDFYYTEGMMRGITDGTQYGVFSSGAMTNKCMREVLFNNLYEIAEFALSDRKYMTISTIHKNVIGYIVEYRDGKRTWHEPTNETSMLLSKNRNDNTLFGFFICDFKPVADYLPYVEDY